MLAACWKIFVWSWSVHYLENIRRVLLKFAMLIKLTVLSLHKRFENTEKYHKHMFLLLFHNNNKTPLFYSYFSETVMSTEGVTISASWIIHELLRQKDSLFCYEMILLLKVVGFHFMLLIFCTLIRPQCWQQLYNWQCLCTLSVHTYTTPRWKYPFSQNNSECAQIFNVGFKIGREHWDLEHIYYQQRRNMLKNEQQQNIQKLSKQKLRLRVKAPTIFFGS